MEPPGQLPVFSRQGRQAEQCRPGHESTRSLELGFGGVSDSGIQEKGSRVPEQTGASGSHTAPVTDRGFWVKTPPSQPSFPMPGLPGWKKQEVEVGLRGQPGPQGMSKGPETLRVCPELQMCLSPSRDKHCIEPCDHRALSHSPLCHPSAKVTVGWSA